MLLLPRAFLWATFVTILGGCSLQEGKDSLSQSAILAHKTASKMDRFWVEINHRAETLDARSSLDSIRSEKETLAKQLKEASGRATDDYRNLRAQYDRLDAAGRLKEARAELDHLRSSGRELQSDLDKASASVERAQRTYDLEKSKCEKIKQEAAEAISRVGG